MPILRDYKGPEPTARILECIKLLLTQNDAQIEQFRKITESPEGFGLSLKHYDIPFVKSKIHNISVFDSKTQNLILNIKSHIDLFNESTEFVMKYHFMTYDSSLTDENRERLKIDIQSRYADLQRRAKVVADRISDFLILGKKSVNNDT